ncbi:MAG: hypothetical protein AAGA35_01310 [Patescibacteria group bacterium]
MFALPTYVGSAHRVVAMLVASALLLLSVGVYTHSAEAANVVGFQDTLTDSAPSAGSDHELEFAVVDSVLAAETIVLTFPVAGGEFVFGGVGADDVAVLDDGVLLTGGGTDYTAVVASPTVTITMVNPIAAGSTTTVRIGANAGGSGDQITNPSTSNTSYEITLTAGDQDTGATRVAIVDTVLVTAEVLTSFDFTVSGLATSTPVNGTSTTGSTTPTAIPFGVVTQDIIETLAQRLNVSTNARNGFVVTVETDQQLSSASGADIDGFSDGTYVNTPGDWADPAETILQEDTYGHWGLTSADDLNAGEFQGCPAAATEGCWVAASTTPRQIFEHDGPADGTTNSVGSTTVGYQIEITGLQEAGDDYNATLTYIATPTF